MAYLINHQEEEIDGRQMDAKSCNELRMLQGLV